MMKLSRQPGDDGAPADPASLPVDSLGRRLGLRQRRTLTTYTADWLTCVDLCALSATCRALLADTVREEVRRWRGKLAPGASHTALVTADGVALTCGVGELGALGHANFSPRRTPTRVLHLADVGARVTVAAANGTLQDDNKPKQAQTFFAATDGSVHVCGGAATHLQNGAHVKDPHSALGRGDVAGLVQTPAPLSTPTRPLFGARVAHVAAGQRHTLFATVDGMAYACGDNVHGSLGVGDTVNRAAPTRVAAYDDGDSGGSAAAGRATAAGGARRGISSFRLPTMGSLRRRAPAPQAPPQQQPGGDVFVVGIAAGGWHSAFVGFRMAHTAASASPPATAALYTCGYGEAGRLGLHAPNEKENPVPTRVVALAPGGLVGAVEGEGVAVASAGYWHTAVVTDRGVVASFGNSKYGQLGAGEDGVHVLNPDCRAGRGGGDIGAGADYQHTRFVQVSCGAYHTLLLSERGEVWSLGKNDYGQLGRSSSLRTQGRSGHAAVSFCPRPERVLPAGAGRPLRFVQVAAGKDHSMALAVDGTVWAWGNDESNQLGTGTADARVEVPTRVPALLAMHPSGSGGRPINLGPSSLGPTLPLRAMGDSDAAPKRQAVTMEAALCALTAELATVQNRIAALGGGSDSALAAVTAAVVAQASATQAQAGAPRAAAEAGAKPDVPGVAATPPMRAAYNLALAFAGRPGASAGTAVRDTALAEAAARSAHNVPQ
eukprot:g3737.t1